MNAPIKLFICYRSTDDLKVNTMLRDLRALKNTTKTPMYEIWQDKLNISEGQDWWESIIDAIEGCDVFVFCMSRESLESQICLTELRYATDRNRPIVPIVLEGEYSFNSKINRNDIDYWDEIPSYLKSIQFLFHAEGLLSSKLKTAVEKFKEAPEKWRDLDCKRPPHPSDTEYANSAMLYSAACDLAERMEFDKARKLFQKSIKLDNTAFGQVGNEWIKILEEYQKLIELSHTKHTQLLVREAWETYKRLFPKKFIAGIFDPQGFEKQFPSRAGSPARRSSSYEIMPQPFGWIAIPEGRAVLRKGGYVLYPDRTFEVGAFHMGKYPITNGQYKRFVEAGGYRERRWWTEAGWKVCNEQEWTKPQGWQEAQFQGVGQPVVGVSWYESLAFCLWLSEISGESIRLPTEQQWQRAAQGDDGRVFPWGNQWANTRCNNSLGRTRRNRTTTVTRFEARGKNAAGVIDLVGNVGQWCLTGYREGSNALDADVKARVLRGASWNLNLINYYKIGYRFFQSPAYRSLNLGFRCVLLN